MAKQGKCEFCKKRLIWEKNYQIKNARCPFCGNYLFGTSYKCIYPVIKISKPEYVYRYTETEKAIDKELKILTGRKVE